MTGSELDVHDRQEAALDRAWIRYPALIREFTDLEPKYTLLAREVESRLKYELEKSGIAVAYTSYRAKSLKSFLEKLERKAYDEPFEQIRDFAGVRIVHLYKVDSPRIDECVQKAFDIHKNEPPTDDTEKFGYADTKYEVSLKSDSIRGELENVDGLICELQVRTVMQDAWAVVVHSLAYKREQLMPREQVRLINALAAQLEVADTMFTSLYTESIARREQMAHEAQNERAQFLARRIDNESLSLYFRRMGVRIPDDPNYGSLALSFAEQVMSKLEIATLGDVDEIVNETHPIDPNLRWTPMVGQQLGLVKG